MEQAGYVYVLKHPYMSDVVKIGKTATTPAQRAAELARPTGVPGPFEIHHSVFVADRNAVESAVHARLVDQRVDGTEFFRVTPDEAVRVLEEVTANPGVVEKPKRAVFSRMTTDLPPEVYTRFKVACAEDGITLADAVRTLISDHLSARARRGSAYA